MNGIRNTQQEHGNGESMATPHSKAVEENDKKGEKEKNVNGKIYISCDCPLPTFMVRAPIFFFIDTDEEAEIEPKQKKNRLLIIEILRPRSVLDIS